MPLRRRSTKVSKIKSKKESCSDQVVNIEIRNSCAVAQGSSETSGSSADQETSAPPVKSVTNSGKTAGASKKSSNSKSSKGIMKVTSKKAKEEVGIHVNNKYDNCTSTESVNDLEQSSWSRPFPSMSFDEAGNVTNHDKLPGKSGSKHKAAAKKSNIKNSSSNSDERDGSTIKGKPSNSTRKSNSSKPEMVKKISFSKKVDNSSTNKSQDTKKSRSSSKKKSQSGATSVSVSTSGNNYNITIDTKTPAESRSKTTPIHTSGGVSGSMTPVDVTASRRSDVTQLKGVDVVNEMSYLPRYSLPSGDVVNKVGAEDAGTETTFEITKVTISKGGEVVAEKITNVDAPDSAKKFGIEITLGDDSSDSKGVENPGIGAATNDSEKLDAIKDAKKSPTIDVQIIDKTSSKLDKKSEKSVVVNDKKSKLKNNKSNKEIADTKPKNSESSNTKDASQQLIVNKDTKAPTKLHQRLRNSINNLISPITSSYSNIRARAKSSPRPKKNKNPSRKVLSPRPSAHRSNTLTSSYVSPNDDDYDSAPETRRSRSRSATRKSSKVDDTKEMTHNIDLNKLVDTAYDISTNAPVPLFSATDTENEAAVKVKEVSRTSNIHRISSAMNTPIRGARSLSNTIRSSLVSVSSGLRGRLGNDNMGGCCIKRTKVNIVMLILVTGCDTSVFYQIVTSQFLYYIILLYI